ncbi:MAG: ATP-binding protein [Solirubrobacterales bacterium]
MSLRRRLVLLFAAVAAGTAGFVYLYVVPQLRSSLTAQELSSLETEATRTRPRLDAAMAKDLGEPALAALLRRLAQDADARATLLAVSAGKRTPTALIADSRGERGPVSAGFETAGSAAATGTEATGVESVSGERSAEVALPIPDRSPRWIAVFSRSLAEVDENMALIERQILIAGAIAIALALAAGYWAARALSRRLGRLEDAARKVADGDFATPIPVDSSDEVGQLALTFNDMQRRLADLDRARKQFIANASHELRTPIFSLGGFVELLEDEDPDPEARAEFVRTMREQVNRLTKLTADLLDLSRLDAGEMRVSPADLDLDALAREVAREFGPAAGRHGSRLQVRTAEAAVLARADPDRTRQIIRILLDNALTHTPEGTMVTVTTYEEQSRAALTVSDEGPGIPKRVQERMFERFYTGQDVGGSGLGLAIARELTTRMAGRISVTSRKGFTAFTLTLPPAAGRPAAPPAPTPIGAGA